MKLLKALTSNQIESPQIMRFGCYFMIELRSLNKYQYPKRIFALNCGKIEKKQLSLHSEIFVEAWSMKLPYLPYEVNG